MSLNQPSAIAAAAHAEALALATTLRQTEHGLAVVLARIHDGGLHRDFGMANVVDYAVELLQLDRRKAAMLLRLGRALPRLPELDRAWAAGELPWTKARELLPVLTPDNEGAWIERAKQVDSRQLEHEVSQCTTGEPPPSHVGEPKAPARTRLVFEMSTLDAELVRAVLRELRADLGPDTDRDDVSDGEILAALIERIAHDRKPADATPTAERYRKVVQVCPCCASPTGIRAEVDDTDVLVASCDAEVLDLRDGPDRGKLSSAIRPKLRRIVQHRDGYRCAVPGCRNCLWIDLHHVERRADGGRHEEDNLISLCSVHHGIVHAGLVAVERRPAGGFVFTFSNGRRVEYLAGAPPGGRCG